MSFFVDTVDQVAGFSPANQTDTRCSRAPTVKTLRLGLLLLACVAMLAAGLRGASPDERLRKADVFSFGGVGFAGITASGEIALREIMMSKDAVARLEALLDGGTPEAKCYALAGLQALAPEKFATQAAKLREKPPERVHVMHGCLAESTSSAALLAKIESKTYLVHFAQVQPNKKPVPTHSAEASMAPKP